MICIIILINLFVIDSANNNNININNYELEIYEFKLILRKESSKNILNNVNIINKIKNTLIDIFYEKNNIFILNDMPIIGFILL